MIVRTRESRGHLLFSSRGREKSLWGNAFIETRDLRRRLSGIEQREEHSRERNNMCRGRKSLVCFCETQRTLEHKERGRWGGGGGMACNEMERGSGWNWQECGFFRNERVSEEGHIYMCIVRPSLCYVLHRIWGGREEEWGYCWGGSLLQQSGWQMVPS